MDTLIGLSDFQIFTCNLIFIQKIVDTLIINFYKWDLYFESDSMIAVFFVNDLLYETTLFIELITLDLSEDLFGD